MENERTPEQIAEHERREGVARDRQRTEKPPEATTEHAVDITPAPVPPPAEDTGTTTPRRVRQ